MHSRSENKPSSGLSGGRVVLMAVASGLAVANLYYAQPLLATLADAFQVPEHQTGLVVTITQVGYALGLMFLVPLGDQMNRRRLVAGMTLVTALACATAALAPSLAIFEVASLVMGVTAVVAQVLIPYVAHLAADHERGRVVGRVMTGLLLGILLARTVSGVIADILGWRMVFWLAAGLMLLQALVLARVLSDERPQSTTSYKKLLGSVLSMVREEPLLRSRMLYGMAVFSAFSAFWTTLPFLLSGAPYHYTNSAIGAFGIVGVAGALCASVAGHLHDHGHNRGGTGGFLALVALSFALMGVWQYSLAAIIGGVLLLDIGVQGAHILNQGEIFRLRPDARSRINTAYMTSFFAGGALGSAAATGCYALGGWRGVAAMSVLVPLGALVYWFFRGEPR